MLGTAALHSCQWHLAATAVFCTSLGVVWWLGRVELGALGQPAGTRISRVIDTLTVATLLLGTFVPYTLVVVLGHDLLNVPSALGALAVVGVLLDQAVFFRRRLAALAAQVGVVWLMVLVLESHLMEMNPHQVTVFMLAIVAYTLIAAITALRGLPLRSRIAPVGVTLGVGAAMPVVHFAGEIAPKLGL